MQMKQALGFAQTTRLFKSLAVGLIFGLLSGSAYYGVGTLIFLMFSFVFNDWVDTDKDKVGHPDRAIPSGKITRRQAFLAAAALLVMGIISTHVLLNEYIFGFAVIYLLSIVYSLILKPKMPILGTPVWSVTIAILFLQPFTTEVSIYIGLTLVVYAYELLLDYRDREADKEFCWTPTLSSVLGTNTLALSGATFAVGAFLLASIVLL